MAKASNKGASAPRATSRAAKGTENKAPEATPLTAEEKATLVAAVEKHGAEKLVEAAKDTAKAKRPPAIVQNGVQRPRAGGLCAAVWELTEQGMKDGELPSIAEVKAAAAEKGLNPTNVSIEYYRCRQFHGVRGRVKKAQPEAQQ